MYADEITPPPMHRRTFSRAAGVSPPWSENRTCEDNSGHIHTRPSHAAPGAAGVSPPWSGNRTCKDNSAEIRTRPSHAAPGAVGVSPPRFVNRTCEDNSAHIPTRPSHAAPRAAGVSPPWLGHSNTVPHETSTVRLLANGRTRAAGVSPPWERNAPAMQFDLLLANHAPSKTAVSPPWVCKPSPQRQCNEFRRLEPACGVHPTGGLRLRRLHLECAETDEFARRIHPTGAYAPRSCFAMRTSADEKTIFAIHIRTSGQERRASARRGWVIRTRYRTKRALFTY
jgi:hypothetical protein